MFMNQASSNYNKFKQALLQYINIVAPVIRSLWSLEAAHANASNVFVFWLAIAATLKDLFSKRPENTGITNSLANQIMAIYNKRYKEFFTNEVYFTSFTLDPRQFCVVTCDACHTQLMSHCPHRVRISELRLFEETQCDCHCYTLTPMPK
jgi:hypothetical protein